MVQVQSSPLTFDAFIAWYPEHSESRYELREGILKQRPKPTGGHSQVASFIMAKLSIEIERRQLPYFRSSGSWSIGSWIIGV